MEHYVAEQSEITCFLESLSYIADTRGNRGKRHPIVFIIVTVTLAMMSGRSKLRAFIGISTIELINSER